MVVLVLVKVSTLVEPHVFCREWYKVWIPYGQWGFASLRRDPEHWNFECSVRDSCSIDVFLHLPSVHIMMYVRMATPTTNTAIQTFHHGK